MKHLKIFDDLINRPIYHDYVLANGMDFNNNLKKFIKENIGRVISKGYSTYRVMYDNIPSDIVSYFHDFYDEGLFVVLPLEDILEYSPNKEDLEIK